MAYDEALAQRIRHQFESLAPFSEKKMFGGWGVMVNGNMCVGVIKHQLVVRVGKDAYEKTLQLKGTGPFDFTGKPLTGWVYVEEDVISSEKQLAAWLNRGLDFVLTLPVK